MEGAAGRNGGRSGEFAPGGGLAFAAAGDKARGSGQQGLRVGVARAGKEGGGGANLDNAAEIHDSDAVGDVTDEAEVVGDEQQRQAKAILQFEEQVDDLGLHGDVERRDRFVGDDHGGLDRERAGDTDALALAAGEGVRVAGRGLGRQVDEFEQFSDAGGDDGGRHDGVDAQRFGQRVANSHAGIERAVRVLEHHLDATVESASLVARERQDVRAIIGDAAGIGLMQADQAAREGGFAAAGFANDADRLTTGDGEADVVDGLEHRAWPAAQGVKRGAAQRETLGEVVNFEQGGGHEGTRAGRRFHAVQALARPGSTSMSGGRCSVQSGLA